MCSLPARSLCASSAVMDMDSAQLQASAAAAMAGPVTPVRCAVSQILLQSHQTLFYNGKTCLMPHFCL